jgi:hypothetical protein
MNRSSRGLILTFATILFGSVLPAAAQDNPALDVSGSYWFLTEIHIGGKVHGWVASVTRNVTPVLGITGEIGGTYKANYYSLLAGPRFASRQDPRVTRYAHMLIGPVIAGVPLRRAYFALQPGGGADFWLRPRLGVRAGIDYRHVFADENSHELRFQLGIVLTPSP